MTIKERLLNRLDQLLTQGSQLLKTGETLSPPYVNYEQYRALRAAALSYITRVYGEQHVYYKEITQFTGKAAYEGGAKAIISILKVIHDEIEGDWLFTIRSLVSAEVFSDFIEMAEHLLSKGYKDPAAVLVGSVLEEHLRQLCNSNNVDIMDSNGKWKKADRVNSDLAKEGVYNKIQQKIITAWLGIRNDAAHGNFNEYTKDQVENMLQGILEFLSRVSAATSIEE